MIVSYLCPIARVYLRPEDKPGHFDDWYVFHNS
jgi:hypothetical protein